MLYYEKIINDINNDWIVFIHGLGGSVKTWKKQIDYYKDKYNILTIDLPGHGKSQNVDDLNKRTPENILLEIEEVLDENKIESAHFEGMSLGTIILLFLCAYKPERIKSAIMAGGIISLSMKVQFYIAFMNIIKHFSSHQFIYNTFSKIIMPKKNHQLSRKLFIRESANLKRQEFLYWANFLKEAQNSNKLIKKINENKLKILYIMGSEDHIFLKNTLKSTKLMNNTDYKIIEHCGHVCNLEKYTEYNKLSENFMLSCA